MSCYGSYLFINQTTGDLSARTHRSAIRSHISSKYYNRRRRTPQSVLPRHNVPSITKPFPPSSALLVRLCSPFVPDWLTLLQFRDSAAVWDYSNPGLPFAQLNTALEVLPLGDHEESYEDKDLISPHPQNLVSNGNSDPFNAFVIPVNACVNQILNFFLETYIPTPYWIVALPEYRANYTDYFEYSLLLNDECSAYAILTRTLQAMSPEALESNHLKVAAVQFYHRSITSLKARLADEKGLWDIGTRVAVYCLMRAATYKGNYEEALIHGRILAHLIQTDLKNSGALLYIYAFYVDFQRSAVTLTRPCFDCDGFPQYFDQLWSEVTERLPPQYRFSHFERTCNNSIHNPALRDMFGGARYFFSFYKIYMADASFRNLPGIRFLQTYIIHVMSRMVTHYLDCVDALREERFDLDHLWVTTEPDPNDDAAPWFKETPPMPLLVQAFAALGGLLFCRLAGRVDTLSFGARSNIFSAHQVILSHMESCVAQWEETASSAEKQEYSDVHLWALYIGAHAEWSVVSMRQQQSATGSSVLSDVARTETITTTTRTRTMTTTTTTTISNTGIAAAKGLRNNFSYAAGAVATTKPTTTKSKLPTTEVRRPPFKSPFTNPNSQINDAPIVRVEHGPPSRNVAASIRIETSSQSHEQISSTSEGLYDESEDGWDKDDEDDGGAQRHFFNRRLASLARDRKLFSWSQVHQILLDGFVYEDLWRPHGSTWFYRTMARGG